MTMGPDIVPEPENAPPAPADPVPEPSALAGLSPAELMAMAAAIEAQEAVDREAADHPAPAVETPATPTMTGKTADLLSRLRLEKSPAAVAAIEGWAEANGVSLD